MERIDSPSESFVHFAVFVVKETRTRWTAPFRSSEATVPQKGEELNQDWVAESDFATDIKDMFG